MLDRDILSDNISVHSKWLKYEGDNMISKNKKQNLVKINWRKKVLDSLEEHILYRGSLH